MRSFPAIETASKNKKLRFLVLISPFNSMRNEVEVLSKGATIRLPKILKLTPFFFRHRYIQSLFE